MNRYSVTIQYLDRSRLVSILYFKGESELNEFLSNEAIKLFREEEVKSISVIDSYVHIKDDEEE